MSLKKFVPMIAFLAILMVAFVVMVQPAGAAVPDPLQIPTPVAVNPGSGVGRIAQLWASKVITADSNTPAMDILNYGKGDLQWVIDQTIVAAAANTTTLTFQFSNDGLNWVNGVVPVSANEADANDMQQYPLFGRYVRLNANVSNGNPITITLGLAAK